jgi:hypothetical protein
VVQTDAGTLHVWEGERPEGHDDEVRAVAYREAATLAHAEGVRLHDDMGQHAAYGAWSVRDLLNVRAQADEADRQPAVEPTIQDAQDAAATLRQAADALDLDADHCGPDYDGTHGLRIAADRLRARADEISGQSAPAGGEQQ